MIKNLTLTFLLVIASIAMSGQVLDWKLSVPPYGRNAFDVAITDTGRVFMFGGSPRNDSLSTICFTYNSVDWDVKIDKINSPVLNAGIFINQDIGLSVGEVGLVLKSVDAGTNWKEILVPTSVNRRKLRSIHFTNDSVGYIVGGNPSNDSIYTILKTTDVGETWSILKDGLGPMLNDVFFINEDTGFAVGEHGYVLKTEDAGVTWAEVTLPGSASFRILNAVCFNSNTSGFILGGNPTNDSIQTILKTMDGGNTWSIVTDKPNPMIQDMSFLNENKGLMVGNNGFAQETVDGGKTWVDIVLPNVNDQWFFTSVHYYNDSTAVIGGRNGALFLSFDSSSFRTLDIQEEVVNNVGIYPNPVKEFFVLKGKRISSLNIYNTSGEVVNESMYSIDGNKVNVKGLPNGVYFVRMVDGKSKVYNHKIIVQ